MFSAFKRTRKGSPQTRGGDRKDSVSSASAAHNDNGLRRRSAETETLLPASFYPRATPMKRNGSRNLPIYTSPGTSTCNSFLLGGQYYPGKDKKRRHMRKKTLWHRIFCSSPWRMLFSSVIICYLLLWHVVVPLTETLMDYGKILSGSKKLDHSLLSAIVLPPLQEQKLQSLRIYEERLRLQQKKKSSTRNNVLEKIVPTWYHRNDADLDENEHKGEHHQRHNAEENVRSKDVRNDANDGQGQKSINARINGSLNQVREGGLEGSDAVREIEVDSEKDATKNKERVENVESMTAARKSAMVRDPARRVEGGNPKTNDRIEPIEPPALAADKKLHDSSAMTLSRNTTSALATPKPNIETNEKLIADGKATAIPAEKVSVKVDSTETVANVRSVERNLLNSDEFPNQSTCPVDLSPDILTTTLMVQFSLDRMWILKETCQRWKDPIVAVVYITKSASAPNLREWQLLCPQMRIIPYQAKDEDQSWGYPVNRLRNVGLDTVNTSHVLVVDVDFVPSMNLHDTIREILHLRKKQRLVIDGMIPEHSDAIVVPAFERLLKVPCATAEECGAHLKSDSTFIPRTINELRGCVEKANCAVFQSNNNWEGHYSTRSASWLKGDFYNPEIMLPGNTTTRMINHVSCFDSLRYEPYVVLRWCPHDADVPKPVAPYYDERFYGYGKNKIEMISHLRFMGYQFSILPEGFIVHHPHPDSEAKKTWNNVKDFKLHENMDSLYPLFLRDLAHKYSNMTKFIVKQCDNDKNPKRKNKTDSSVDKKETPEEDLDRSQPLHPKAIVERVAISGDK